MDPIERAKKKLEEQARRRKTDTEQEARVEAIRRQILEEGSSGASRQDSPEDGPDDLTEADRLAILAEAGIDPAGGEEPECPLCDEPIGPGAKSCRSCGASLTPPRARLVSASGGKYPNSRLVRRPGEDQDSPLGKRGIFVLGGVGLLAVSCLILGSGTKQEGPASQGRLSDDDFSEEERAFLDDPDALEEAQRSGERETARERARAKRKVEAETRRRKQAALRRTEENRFDREARRSARAESSLEYQLATINADGYVRKDDASVMRFRYLLSELVVKTKNSRQEIADMTVRSRSLLLERFGREIGLLELMEAANQSIPSDAPKLDYAEIVSALVVLLGR